MRPLIFGCFVLLIASCTEEKSLVNQELIKIKREYLESKFSQYQSIYDQAVDTVEAYVADSSVFYKSLFFNKDWQLDSVFIFNVDSTRFYTKLYYAKDAARGVKHDAIYDFGGAFLKGHWRFFKMGTTTIVPRDHYQYDAYDPLTFEELSYIAWKGLPDLLSRMPDGRFLANERTMKWMFFSTDRLYCTDKHRIKVCKDSFYLENLRQVREFKVSREACEKARKAISSNNRPYVKPLEDLPEKEQRKYKKLLFESDAWKNRRNKDLKI